jgi:TRAP-type mannitol/chloroaromatic compound transport system permease small subunit
MLSLYTRCIEQLSELAYRLAQLLILIAILVCCGNALSRKLLDLSSNAFLEIQWYCFGSAFLLAGAKTLSDNAHIRIDVLASRLSPAHRYLIDLIGLSFCLLPFCLMMVRDGWFMFADAWLRQEMSADAGGLLRWPIKLMIPLGFSLLGLQATVEILKTLHQWRGGAR